MLRAPVFLTWLLWAQGDAREGVWDFHSCPPSCPVSSCWAPESSPKLSSGKTAAHRAQSEALTSSTRTSDRASQVLTVACRAAGLPGGAGGPGGRGVGTRALSRPLPCPQAVRTASTSPR